tara:strand:- start:1958 stop:2365 length:408 start_codon:yes stop_codon:yes gene_type:complete
MTTKNEMLRELFIANGLVKDEDTYDLPYGKRSTIITKNGIEKIQYHNNIQVRYEVVSMEPDFVVIKAIATKGDVTVESFGESTPENTKQSPPYHSAMAEKRALSRAVLKITGFYKYGVYGEDESDDFKRKVKEAA